MTNFFYNQYSSSQTQALADNEKSKEFLSRVESFKDVKTLAEAKMLAENILPSKDGLTSFYVGDIKCTILNNKDLLRITIDSSDNYICYDFS